MGLNHGILCLFRIKVDPGNGYLPSRLFGLRNLRDLLIGRISVLVAETCRIRIEIRGVAEVNQILTLKQIHRAEIGFSWKREKRT